MPSFVGLIFGYPICADLKGCQLTKNVNFPKQKCPRTPQASNDFQFGLYRKMFVKKFIPSRYVDAKVLNFLNKIKPLFTNVFLAINSRKWTTHENIVLVHLLPMLGGIRLIRCVNDCMEHLEREFPGTLARANELEWFYPESTCIPACLDWLNAPQNFDVNGPRFIRI